MNSVPVEFREELQENKIITEMKHTSEAIRIKDTMLKTQPEVKVMNRLEESQRQKGKDRDIKKRIWEFPGGPVVKTQCFYC